MSEKEKYEVEPFDVLEKRLEAMVNSINLATQKIDMIDRKLGSEGLVNIDKFYTLQEVSKIVGLSPYHIRKDIENGKLKPLKRGGRTVFNKEKIDSYIKD